MNSEINVQGAETHHHDGRRVIRTAIGVSNVLRSCVALLGLAGVFASTTQASPPCPTSGTGPGGSATYQDLIDLGSCFIADQVFSGFTFAATASGGATAPTASNVNYGLDTNSPSLIGFEFAMSLNAAFNGTNAVRISYNVNQVSGVADITSLHHNLIGIAIVGGSINVNETYCLGAFNSAGCASSGALNTSGFTGDERVTFPPVSELSVITDIIASGNGVGFAAISGVRNAVSIAPDNTLPNSNVSVQPQDAATGTTPVTVTFNSVTSPGLTSLTISSSGPTPPAGFELGSSYYYISTTAGYTAPVQVCISDPGGSSSDQLLHYETGIGWVNVPASFNLTTQVLCGSVSSLSPFAVMRRIDTTPPAITFMLSPNPNVAGWNNSSVSITWNPTDPESAIMSSTGCGPLTLTTETAGTLLTCTATNGAGLSNSVSATIKIDKTAPGIALTSRTAANGAGWNKTAVSLLWACSDSLSGPAQASVGRQVSTEGANQSATGTCMDIAGNSASDTQTAINIDLTPPALAFGVASPAANSNGWNNTNVAVPFAASDSLSGVSGTNPAVSPLVLMMEGAAVSATVTVTDVAGNTATFTSPAFQIDKTPPLVTYIGNAGTYTVDQGVTITCGTSDSLSGVAVTTCANISGPAYSFNVGMNSFSATATDRAGNIGIGSVSFAVQVTAASLASLTQRFVTQPGIANSMIAKLSAAADAAARGNANAKAGAINAYINEVTAQSGKALTADQAAVLIRLAQAL